MPARESALESWISQQLNSNDYTLSLLAGDASSRRYFRVLHKGDSWVVMDAPPQFEPITSFIEVANLLNTYSVHVPKIKALDQEHGFILLEDLGDTLFQDAFDTDSADKYYRKALNQLLQIQTIPTGQSNLARYDVDRMRTELDLFLDWFCKQYLQLNLNQQVLMSLKEVFSDLADKIADQPLCFVHRDYHSRNIMAVSQNPIELSIIDFQDAVIGPYTYDVVSLLKDCYIDWPDDQQQHWCQYYFQHCQFNTDRSLEQFMLDYHMCGLQRHLRVLGTFSRLYLRDGKHRYLADMPRLLNYINHTLAVTGLYPSLQQFMNDKVRLP